MFSVKFVSFLSKQQKLQLTSLKQELTRCNNFWFSNPIHPFATKCRKPYDISNYDC